MSQVDRRSFIKAGGVAAGSTLLGSTGLQAISMRMAEARPRKRRGPQVNADYGRLFARRPVNRKSKYGGEEWLALPAGFRYSILSWTGKPMTDGTLTPRSHDGMGAFGSADSKFGVRLIRNHEIRFNTTANLPPDDAFAQGDYTIAAGANAYDRTAGGGNTTLTFDARKFHKRSGGLVEDFVSQTGTVVNCAGGIAYRRAGWLTCEEIVQQEIGDAKPGTVARTERKHGYVYLTPLDSPTPGNPAGADPFVAMGRFAHEAATVDQDNGIVYETEDAGSGRGSGFYRFTPKDPADLAKGGLLQILCIQDEPSADLREGQRMGKPLRVRWYTVAEPNPPGDAPNAVFETGFRLGGAAKFNRLEGCWFGGESVFFASTSGGDAKNGDVNPDGFAEGYGQIWEYTPGGASGEDLLTLLYESPGGDVLDSPDNLVVSPRGGLLLCEDDASSVNLGQSPTDPFFGEDKNRLIGLTMDGQAFQFAENVRNDSEMAGACWSDDGEFLFVNIFGLDEAGSGGTFAITGPWSRGAL